ncbi:MAG: hypothetical protein R6V53_07310 [Candidatus Woesearchaeota archaeon]
MIRRCERCRRFLFFTRKTYCEDCKQEIAEEEKQRKIAEKRKRDQEKAKIRNRIADEKLREELRKPKKTKSKDPEKNKKAKRSDKTGKTEKAEEVEDTKKITKKPKLPTNAEIAMYPRLLYLEVSVNRIKAIEWIDGKKRQAVNKKREVRRTHAGGFSAEKFQRFVDQKKKKTFEWIVDVLTRPGVLKPYYDKIIIESQDEDLKSALDCFLSDEGYTGSE